MACYASEMRFASCEMPHWGQSLKVKLNAGSLYRRDQARARQKGEPLSIFMSSVTDPYVPQERRYRITRGVLSEMLESPPDILVIQTHTPNVLWDVETLYRLHKQCYLTVQISIETDQETLAGFPRHAYSVSARLAALRELTKAGLKTVGVVSPLLPLAEPELFAACLGEAASAVILDHYLIGDGSPNGMRTRRKKPFHYLPVPELIAEADCDAWNTLGKFYQVVETFQRILGSDRVGVSAEGFQAMAGN
ncbi:MAG: radical SAM protein [Nitrospiraceae bacterium]|nr:radical SAM protein [Nitrospiraceae bacterium]